MDAMWRLLVAHAALAADTPHPRRFGPEAGSWFREAKRKLQAKGYPDLETS